MSTDPKIGPVYSGVKMKNRTAQLTGTYITTELGLLYMDAFYSTKSKQDISAGNAKSGRNCRYISASGSTA